MQFFFFKTNSPKYFLFLLNEKIKIVFQLCVVICHFSEHNSHPEYGIWELSVSRRYIVQNIKAREEFRLRTIYLT